MNDSPASSPLMVAWVCQGRQALVVGGGAVSLRRTRALLLAGAEVWLVAPEVRPELEQLPIAVSRRRWQATDLDGADLALVAIDEPEVSREIFLACRERGIVVHVADRPELCDFWFAAVHREGPVQVAISTGGAGPALAGRLRDELAATLPKNLAAAVEGFGRLRQAARSMPLGVRMAWLRERARALSWNELASLDEARVEGLVEGRGGEG